MRLAGRAVRAQEDRSRIELVAVLEVFGLAVEDAVVFDFHRVEVVGIETEDGDARMGADVFVRDRVADRLAAHLRENRHGRVLDDVAAVADDGGERRDLVGIDHHFADVALRLEGDGRAARAARSEDTARERGDARRKSRIDGNTFDLHGSFLFSWRRRCCRPLSGSAVHCRS